MFQITKSIGLGEGEGDEDTNTAVILMEKKQVKNRDTEKKWFGDIVHIEY